MSYDISKLSTLGQLKNALQVINAGIGAKLDLPVVVTATVGTTIGDSGMGVWIADTTYSDFPYRYDIADSNVLSTDIASVTIAPGSENTARTCGLSSSNQTLDGAIRLYSKYVPSDSISVEYTLTATYVITTS